VLNVGMRCNNPNFFSVAIEQPEAGTLDLASRASTRRLEVSNEDYNASAVLGSGWLDNLLDDDDEEKHSSSSTTITTTLDNSNSDVMKPQKNKDTERKNVDSSTDIGDDIIDWIGDKIDGKDDKNIALGTITLLPSTLRAHQNSTLSLRGNIILDGVAAVDTIARLLGPANIRFKLGLKTQLVILGQKIVESREDKICGVQVDVTNDKSGEAVCGKSFAGLRIPPIATNITKQPITFNADPEEVKEAETLRDLVLDTAQIIGYGFGIPGILFWLAMTLKARFSKTNEGSASSARAVTLTRSATKADEIV